MKSSLILTLTLTIGLLGAALGSARAADAAANFEQHCAKCHGKDGKGQTKMGQKLNIKDYTDAKVQEKLKDADALKAIKEGVKEKGSDKVVMKPVEGLSDDEIKALVAFLRKFKK
jgi:cytochrome c553